MHNWSWRSVYSSRAVLHIVSVRYGKVFLHVVCYKLSGVANAPVIFFYFILFIFLSGNFQWVRATHASSGHSGDSCVSLRISGPIKTCSSLLCPVIARAPLFFCETIEVISLQCIIDRRPSKINKQKSSNLFAIPWGGFALWTRFGDDGRSSQTHRPTTRSEQRSSGERGPFLSASSLWRPSYRWTTVFWSDLVDIFNRPATTQPSSTMAMAQRAGGGGA